MKKMNRRQKDRWNRLSARRRTQYMKRKPRVEALKKAQKKINLTLRQIEAASQ